MAKDKMFHESTDENGVEISSNCHSAASFGHPLAEQVPGRPHWMAGESGSGGYMEPPAQSIVHKTKDRIIGGQGSRPGAMSFDGDLLPRSERLPRAEAGRGVEVHDPSCWCDLCHPLQTAPGNPVAYRR
jgi:hypothetical protein